MPDCLLFQIVYRMRPCAAVALVLSLSLASFARAQEEAEEGPPPHTQHGPPWAVWSDDNGWICDIVPYNAYDPTDTSTWSVIYPNGLALTTPALVYDTTVELAIVGWGYMVVDMGTGEGQIFVPDVYIWPPPGWEEEDWEEYYGGDHGGPPPLPENTTGPAYITIQLM